VSTSTSWSELSATAAERRSLGIATQTTVYADGLLSADREREGPPHEGGGPELTEGRDRRSYPETPTLGSRITRGGASRIGNGLNP
jgi:hypothetical protein